MIRAATVRMTTCRNVKPNKIESWLSTFAGTRARIGASVSRRAIGDHLFRSGRVRRGGDGGDGGSTRRGRAGTAGTDRAGGDPARVVRVAPPGAGRAGVENTGVTGAGGRFGAVCGRVAAEKLAAGTLPVGGRLGTAGVGRWLNWAGAGRAAGAGVG